MEFNQVNNNKGDVNNITRHSNTLIQWAFCSQCGKKCGEGFQTLGELEEALKLGPFCSKMCKEIYSKEGD